MQKKHLVHIYRNQLGVNIQGANTVKALETGMAAGLMENISNLTSGVMGGRSQGQPKPDLAEEGMQKLSSAAKEISGALGNFGAQFLGKAGDSQKSDQKTPGL